MEPMHAVTAVFCVLVGLSLGLLGGGGSVLMVPLFVYVARLPVREAIAVSLLIAGVSGALGSVRYIRQGLVNRRLVVLFILPGVAASFWGARVAGSSPPQTLLFLFGAMMLLISAVLYRKSSQSSDPDTPATCHPDFFLSAAVGGGIGFLTGLLGVGGGFLIVPAIALLMKCSLRTAIGTSLAIITVNSLAGFAGHFPEMRTDLLPAAVFLAATAGGAALGSGISARIGTRFLQKAFAVLIFLVGLFLLIKNIS